METMFILLGWGLLRQFPPFRYFPNFSTLSKQELAVEYYVYIWKVLPRSPVNSPHKGQWCGALMFSSICARINGWVNNGEAGDLRRHPVHCDVIVMVVGSNRLCIKQSSTKDITSYIIWTSADYNVDHLQPLPNICHAQNMTCIKRSL